jgi:hypothetical protein
MMESGLARQSKFTEDQVALAPHTLYALALRARGLGSRHRAQPLNAALASTRRRRTGASATPK